MEFKCITLIYIWKNLFEKLQVFIAIFMHNKFLIKYKCLSQQTVKEWSLFFFVRSCWVLNCRIVSWNKIQNKLQTSHLFFGPRVLRFLFSRSYEIVFPYVPSKRLRFRSGRRTDDGTLCCSPKKRRTRCALTR